VRKAVEKAADWAMTSRNSDGGFGDYPGWPSDMDAVYFQCGGGGSNVFTYSDRRQFRAERLHLRHIRVVGADELLSVEQMRAEMSRRMPALSEQTTSDAARQRQQWQEPCFAANDPLVLRSACKFLLALNDPFSVEQGPVRTQIRAGEKLGTRRISGSRTAHRATCYTPAAGRLSRC
jgi:hypothetical protein